MDWLSDNLWSAWLTLAVVLGVAEMLSLDLVLIMLAAGALAGMVAALLDAHVAVQAIAAGAASVAMLAFVRPSFVKRLHSGPDLQLGHGKLVGRTGVVTAPITGLETGRVRIAGEIWSASPYDDTLTIAVGETVEVMQIRGATALVHPVPTLDR